MEPEVRALRRDDDRSVFRSGDPSLDVFFSQYAGQDQFKASASVTYVVEHDGRIGGYATVTAAAGDAPTPLFLKIGTIKEALRGP